MSGLTLGAEECQIAGPGLARAGRWVLSGAVSTEICLISQNWEVLFSRGCSRALSSRDVSVFMPL